MNSRGGAWRGHVATVSLALLAFVLYGRGLWLGFVGDDFALLDAALRHPLGELLTGRYGIAGFYRPISRELYFWWWGRVLHLGPFGFHVVNALTYALVVVMIARLAGTWAGSRIGRLATIAFVVFPPGSALLSWVSCAQDLIALFWAMVTLVLFQSGRHRFAAVAVLLAALAKETAMVLPLALVALDWSLHPTATRRERMARCAPAFAAVAVAIAIGLGVRSTWPGSTRATIWSARQLAGAGMLPFDFIAAYLPPDLGAGIGAALRLQPAWLIFAAAFAAIAVPQTTVPPQSADAPAGPSSRALLLFGLALALIAALPVAVVAERWRAYYFSLAGVGTSLAIGAVLARVRPGLAGALLAAAAVVNFGAGSIYRPVESASGAGRHPHANYAFFRETGELSNRMLAALEPWCDAIRSVPHTFVAGIAPDAMFTSVLGPGLRVTCRDTVSRVRFLAAFTSADARTDFGVLRVDPATGGFRFERADDHIRARIGQGFLIHARYEEAAACFEAAAAPRGADWELSYPLVSALAAAGRATDAERIWRDARARGAVLDAATMANRMLGRVMPAPGAPAPEIMRLGPLAEDVLKAPWQAPSHLALGRELLAEGRTREGTFELAIAAGITRKPPEVAWLGQGYEAMGALDEAHAAYRRALAGGLPRDLYMPTRERFFALEKQRRAMLDRPPGRP